MLRPLLRAKSPTIISRCSFLLKVFLRGGLRGRCDAIHSAPYDVHSYDCLPLILLGLFKFSRCGDYRDTACTASTKQRVPHFGIPHRQNLRRACVFFRYGAVPTLGH